MSSDGEYVPEPWLYRLPKVSHYYGDSVRQLMLTAAGIMLFAMPWYTDDLSIELPFIIFGVVVLVCVAALTTPRKQSVINADAVASGVGLVIFEWWALYSYGSVSIITFGIREVIAILFFFALYFSTKTLRAMRLHQIGKHDTPYDLEEASPSEISEDAETDRAEVVVPQSEEMREANEHAKHEYQ